MLHARDAFDGRRVDGSLIGCILIGEELTEINLATKNRYLCAIEAAILSARCTSKVKSSEKRYLVQLWVQSGTVLHTAWVHFSYPKLECISWTPSDLRGFC